MNTFEVVITWLLLNRLTLNIDKTAFITFVNYKDSVSYELNITIVGNTDPEIENNFHQIA